MMFSTKKIVTIIGVFIILASLGVGGYFVSQNTNLFFQPDPEITPKKVKITNVGDDRFTVSWITEKATPGLLLYGVNGKTDKTQLNDLDQLTGQTQAYKIHHVTLTNLEPSTSYAFKVQTGEKASIFDNQGKPYAVKTAATLGTQPPTDLISGSVELNGGTPAEGAVVYISLPGVIPLSTQVKKDGSWLINLSVARNTQLTDYANYDLATSLIDIFVQGDSLVSKIITNTANDSPVPLVTLGQTYDFTQNTAASSPQSASTEKNAKSNNQAEPLSQFPVEFSGEEGTIADDEGNTDLEEDEDAGLYVAEQSTTTNEVTIINPGKDLEELFTNRPEFLGNGPANKVLTISITSLTTIKGTAIVDSGGDWSYSPSTDLTAGTYTLTVDYFDSQGKPKNISRRFVITTNKKTTGSQTKPAFESTPSAKPSATPIPRVVIPSTSSGVPVSGVSVPTYMVLVIGLMMLGGGLYVKSQSARKT